MNMEEDDLGARNQTGSPLFGSLSRPNENHRGYLGTGHLNWAEICQALAEIGLPVARSSWNRSAALSTDVVAAARTVALTVL